MASAPPTLSPLSYPAEVFAKLAPGPYLRAHLQESSKTGSTRPSGRSLTESRTPSIHTGSISHSNGSSVIRLGDTAIVCGIRAEILRAQDIPQPYKPRPSSLDDPAADDDDDDEIATLGLLIPNIELSTGCSPHHLPGNPPTPAAQSLTHRLHSLLHRSRLLRASDLRITGSDMSLHDTESAAEQEAVTVTKANWALYIDVLVLSHDGCLFDAAWFAVRAALADVRLPLASWDADREMAVCDPRVERARALDLRAREVQAMTFACFEDENRIRGVERGRWVLADPDLFEERLCRESVTVAVAGGGVVVGIEKSGGVGIGVKVMEEVVEQAVERQREWEGLLARAAEGRQR